MSRADARDRIFQPAFLSAAKEGGLVWPKAIQPLGSQLCEPFRPNDSGRSHADGSKIEEGVAFLCPTGQVEPDRPTPTIGGKAPEPNIQDTSSIFAAYSWCSEERAEKGAKMRSFRGCSHWSGRHRRPHGAPTTNEATSSWQGPWMERPGASQKSAFIPPFVGFLSLGACEWASRGI